MALIKRVARLFHSDMHAVLDRLEDPESLMKHSIREMEEDLRRDTLQAKYLPENVNRSVTRLKRQNCNWFNLTRNWISVSSPVKTTWLGPSSGASWKRGKSPPDYQHNRQQ